MGNLEISLTFVKPDILFFCLFGFIIAALMPLGKLVREREREELSSGSRGGGSAPYFSDAAVGRDGRARMLPPPFMDVLEFLPVPGGTPSTCASRSQRKVGAM